MRNEIEDDTLQFVSELEAGVDMQYENGQNVRDGEGPEVTVKNQVDGVEESAEKLFLVSPFPHKLVSRNTKYLYRTIWTHLHGID